MCLSHVLQNGSCFGTLDCIVVGTSQGVCRQALGATLARGVRSFPVGANHAKVPPMQSASHDRTLQM